MKKDFSVMSLQSLLRRDHHCQASDSTSVKRHLSAWPRCSHSPQGRAQLTQQLRVPPEALRRCAWMLSRQEQGPGARCGDAGAARVCPGPARAAAGRRGRGLRPRPCLAPSRLRRRPRRPIKGAAPALPPDGRSSRDARLLPEKAGVPVESLPWPPSPPPAASWPGTGTTGQD